MTLKISGSQMRKREGNFFCKRTRKHLLIYWSITSQIHYLAVVSFFELASTITPPTKLTKQTNLTQTKLTKLAKPKPKNTPPILKQHIVLNVAQLKD